ncbi:unnamed protein product [Linum tenue]|uniref:TMV resistance protein N-like n=1 Tax=Linum tenue TaxID=586396 RepID=A0AAV0K7L7_9ROSI|nr:unnamed protein product [Linum tenue]
MSNNFRFLDPLISIDVASQLPIKLTGAANYSSWRRQFHSLLAGYGLQGYLDGTITPPPTSTLVGGGTTLASRHWTQQDQRIFHAIMASVDEETIAPFIVSCPTARDAWLGLERLFVSRSRSQRLNHVKNQSVSVFLTSLKRFANDLALAGHHVDDADLVLHALNGVGPEFEEIVAAIYERGDPISFEELFYELVKFEGKEDDPTTRVVCQYCDEPGHAAKTCPRITTTTISSSSSSCWLADSATTQHITNALGNLSFSQFLNGPNSLINGDASEINFTKGAVTVIVLLLQPIVLLYKLLFGRNIFNAAQQSDAINPFASVPRAVSDAKDHQNSAPNNKLPQQSNDGTSASTVENPRSASSLPTGEHEVFLSFRGPDTRQVFTNTLFILLRRLSIRTFMDDEKLEKGDEIWPSLATAIRQSKIHVAILSENYAYSKWCLRELVKFVECRKQDKRHIILPIFYMVDPGDVRHQTGPYQSAFQQHEKKFDSKTVQDWRDALNEVGTIKGWTVGSKDKPGEIADRVCNEIWLHIRQNDKFLDRDRLVGIDDHIRAVTDELSLDSEGVTMVGLHGLGGIGKTTIARAVYNQISTSFDRCSFLENIREMQEQKNGTIDLQHKLISNIMRKDSLGSIDNDVEGKNLIKDRVSMFKVLIILDDVDEKFKFEDVLGNPGQFASGTRFIITSRNEKVLRTVGENQCKLYEVGQMSPRISLELFCKHAFKKTRPPPGYETLSQDIISIAGGLPLFLEVVGSLLYGEEKPIWEEKLVQLRKVSLKGVAERLKISYDVLEAETQQIFLDIACFCIGMEKEIAIYMWSDLKYLSLLSRINSLIQRSMIKIGYDNKFQMHDQMRDMGREIVREENIEQPWKRSRIWDPEEALDLLQNKRVCIF